MNHMTSGIMVEVLRSRAQDKLLDTLRSTYAARAAALTTALRASLPPGATISHTDGGFFCWLVLPEGVRAEDAIALAMAHDECPTSALPGSNFSPSGGFRDCIRMAFTYYDEDQLARAGAVIGDAVTKLSSETL